MKTKRCFNVNEKRRQVEGEDGRTKYSIVYERLRPVDGGNKKKHKVVFLKKGA